MVEYSAGMPCGPRMIPRDLPGPGLFTTPGPRQCLMSPAANQRIVSFCSEAGPADDREWPSFAGSRKNRARCSWGAVNINGTRNNCCSQTVVAAPSANSKASHAAAGAATPPEAVEAVSRSGRRSARAGVASASSHRSAFASAQYSFVQ